MRNRFVAGLLVGLLAVVATVTLADEQSPEYQNVITAFEKTFPTMKVSQIQASPIDGLLLISVGAEVFYVSADGKYLIAGDMYSLADRKNLTDVVRDEERIALLAQLTDDSTILFAADEPEYTVTVFTDIDCGYCRKLHRQMSAYNDAGISIRYAFFPRSGPDTPSWEKAEAVWCAESQQDALTAAKTSQPYDSEECETPVAAHYELVNQLGLRGTPALFTEKGQFISGYVSADELLEILEEEST